MELDVVVTRCLIERVLANDLGILRAIEGDDDAIAMHVDGWCIAYALIQLGKTSIALQALCRERCVFRSGTRRWLRLSSCCAITAISWNRRPTHHRPHH